MSLAVFQSGMARLISDPDFRDRVLAAGEAALPADLTAQERRRLLAIATDRGLDINRTLHKGFRLGKLRALLPLTCRLLGARRLARELPRFWAERPPSSFSFLPEALDFCDWLSRRRLRLRYLDDVLGYERARLEFERAREGAPPTQLVRVRHDPARLLAALAAGRRPRAIPRCDGWLIAAPGRDGHLQWRLRADADTATAAT